MAEKKQDILVTFVSFAAMKNGNTMIPPEVNAEICNPKIGSSAYIFFLQLLAFKDETNILHLSLEDWIEATRSSAKEVVKCLRILESAGWIKSSKSRYKGFVQVEIKFGKNAYSS